LQFLLENQQTIFEFIIFFLICYFFLNDNIFGNMEDIFLNFCQFLLILTTKLDIFFDLFLLLFVHVIMVFVLFYQKIVLKCFYLLQIILLLFFHLLQLFVLILQLIASKCMGSYFL